MCSFYSSLGINIVSFALNPSALLGNSDIDVHSVLCEVNESLVRSLISFTIFAEDAAEHNFVQLLTDYFGRLNLNVSVQHISLVGKSFCCSFQIDKSLPPFLFNLFSH